ncbi:hypothetical protein HK405_001689, partial [Cladochytrium tenue]
LGTAPATHQSQYQASFSTAADTRQPVPPGRRAAAATTSAATDAVCFEAHCPHPWDAPAYKADFAARPADVVANVYVAGRATARELKAIQSGAGVAAATSSSTPASATAAAANSDGIGPRHASLTRRDFAAPARAAAAAARAQPSLWAARDSLADTVTSTQPSVNTQASEHRAVFAAPWAAATQSTHPPLPAAVGPSTGMAASSALHHQLAADLHARHAATLDAGTARKAHHFELAPATALSVPAPLSRSAAAEHFAPPAPAAAPFRPAPQNRDAGFVVTLANTVS